MVYIWLPVFLMIFLKILSTVVLSIFAEHQYTGHHCSADPQKSSVH